MEFHPGQFTITIQEGDTVLDSITIADSTYPSGKFGFYNYSQGQVRCSGFTLQAIPGITYRYDADAIDPDQDIVTYSLGEEKTYGYEILHDDPVGYWRMNELGGPTAIDATTNGVRTLSRSSERAMSKVVPTSAATTVCSMMTASEVGNADSMSMGCVWVVVTLVIVAVAGALFQSHSASHVGT